MSAGTAERVDPPVPEVRDPAERHRRNKAVVVLSIVLALLVYFAVDAKSKTVKYILGERVSQDHPTHELAAAPGMSRAAAKAVLEYLAPGGFSPTPAPPPEPVPPETETPAE